MTRRKLVTVWIAGVTLEALILGAAALLLETPVPPLVDQLRGTTDQSSQIVVFSDTVSAPITTAEELRPGAMQPPSADSFYTVLHWPLDKPLLEGGGRVLAFPMRYLWVPIAIVGIVPLALVVYTILWFAARRRTVALASPHAE